MRGSSPPRGRRAKGVGGPYAQEAAWGVFCHDIACWELLGHGALMADLRATGECVGQVGINHGPLFPEKELGWLVYEGHEGRGYATEAARTLRDWAARALGLDGLVSYVDPENRRSARVAERLGATLHPDAPKQDPGDLVYRHSGRSRAPLEARPRAAVPRRQPPSPRGPRRMATMLRLLRGEDPETVSRSLGVTAATLTSWRDAFLAAGEASLATRPAEGEALEGDRLEARLGEMLLERGLLGAKIAALEANRPLAPWRRRP